VSPAHYLRTLHIIHLRTNTQTRHVFTMSQRTHTYSGADLNSSSGDWAVTAEQRLREVCRRQQQEIEALGALVAQQKRDTTRLRRQLKLAQAGRVVNINADRKRQVAK
jgi:uncharacterized coiled-coil protein SlyX